MTINEVHFHLETVIIHFVDKPYQEINLKSVLLLKIQIVYYAVNKEKYRQICTFPVWFCFTIIVCTHICNEVEKDPR